MPEHGSWLVRTCPVTVHIAHGAKSKWKEPCLADFPPLGQCESNLLSGLKQRGLALTGLDFGGQMFVQLFGNTGDPAPVDSKV